MRKVLIVTGGSRGIGAATARLAGARGYAVCVNYRARKDEAERVVADIRHRGGEAIAVQADTASEADVARLFDVVDRELGPLDALVNNAGTTGTATMVADLDLANLQTVVAINVVGYFLCAREAIRRMATSRGGKGGAIVNVSSRASVLGGANEWVHYAASKGATDSMTVGLSREVGGLGIRVNAVRPGLIETDIHAAAGRGDRLKTLSQMVPSGRIGSPEEVANTILWLLSDEASYVNGALVDIGGGR